jgi:hypothetical protein
MVIHRSSFDIGLSGASIGSRSKEAARIFFVSPGLPPMFAVAAF